MPERSRRGCSLEVCPCHPDPYLLLQLRTPAVGVDDPAHRYRVDAQAEAGEKERKDVHQEPGFTPAPSTVTPFATAS